MSTITAKIGKEKYTTVLSNGRHEFQADEPSPIGNDAGPTPYDFLLMSLGSCVAMTLRMYADRKGWNLDAVEVELSQERVHAKDCENCNTDDGFVHLIEKKVKLIGDLDEKQRKRLLEISDRCPVNKTLLNEIVIKTSMQA